MKDQYVADIGDYGKTVGGKNYYSNWSSKKYVTTK